MRPVEPIVPGHDLPVDVFAKDQPEYIPLPAHVLHDERGTILMRWHMTWRERFTVLFRGDVYLWVTLFNNPLQPIALEVTPPECKRDETEGRVWLTRFAKWRQEEKHLWNERPRP